MPDRAWTKQTPMSADHPRKSIISGGDSTLESREEQEARPRPTPSTDGYSMRDPERALTCSPMLNARTPSGEMTCVLRTPPSKPNPTATRIQPAISARAARPAKPK